MKNFPAAPGLFWPMPLPTAAVIYAVMHFSNLHEFWAVSVEAFFENPKGLKENMPDLYEALCRVLNQDPLNPM